MYAFQSTAGRLQAGIRCWGFPLIAGIFPCGPSRFQERQHKGFSPQHRASVNNASSGLRMSVIYVMV